MKTITSSNAVENSLRPLASATPTRERFERRAIVLSVAALMYAAVLLARQVVVTDRDAALGLLLVIPVALVGLELGLWAGVGLALLTTALVAFAHTASNPDMDAVGIATRGVAIMSVGVLSGHFSDRMRAFQVRQAELLTAERERLALLGELRSMHRRLQDQVRSAGHILDQHDQERRGIAEQLHEQAAQAMAAALLVVGRLERDIVDELTQAQLQRARSSVNDSIAELRRLAGSLHSPVLEELGLRPALERLVEHEREDHSRTIDLHDIDELPQLPADVEISAYRVIEEALKAIPGPIGVRIVVGASSDSLQIVIEGRWDSGEREDDVAAMAFLAARARLETIGGSLTSSRTPEGSLLTASIPFAREPIAAIAASRR